MICAVVPAHNEAETIASVVSVLLTSPDLSRVLVVDDGSADNTAEVASQAGAQVLKLSPNRGKGQAMLAGVRSCPGAEAILFCDSDLLGFKLRHVQDLVDAFYELDADQAVGVRNHFFGGMSLVASAALAPLISGERIVSARVLEQVPSDCWSGYAIETAINNTVDRLGGVTAVVPMAGLKIRNKTSKVGLFSGTLKNVKMFSEVAQVRESLGRCGRCSGGAPSARSAAAGAVGAFGALAHALSEKALAELKEAL